MSNETEQNINQNQKQPLVITQIVSFSWGITIVVSLILYFIQMDINMPISFFLGAMTSVLTFNMIRNSVYKSIMSGVQSLQAKTIANYILRFLVYALVLYVASQKDTINIYLVFAGFFVVKLAILLRTAIFRDKE